MSTARYAVYFAPATGTRLHDFGCAVLGRDAATGEATDVPTALVRALPDWSEIVAPAAHYGFHATLKAPFELVAGADPSWLDEEVAALAAGLRSIDLGRLKVSGLGNFVALVPMQPVPSLPSFASTIVTMLDSLRAPLSDADRARRQPKSLTDRQRQYLDRWGYPYVHEDFRFHMTLTGPLSGHRQLVAIEALSALYAMVDEPVRVDALSVFAQPHRAGEFQLRNRYTFPQ